MYGYVGIARAVCGYVGLCSVLYGYEGLCKARYGYIGLYSNFFPGLFTVPFYPF